MALWLNGAHWHPNKVASGELERTPIFQGPSFSGPRDLKFHSSQVKPQTSRRPRKEIKSPSFSLLLCKSPETASWEVWRESGHKWNLSLCVMGARAMPISLNVSGLCVECVCVCVECVCGACESIYQETLALKVVPACVGFTKGGRYLGSRNVSTFPLSPWTLWPKIPSTVFLSFLCCVACGILVSRQGIEPRPLSLEAWNLSHWTAREVHKLSFFVTFSNPPAQGLWNSYCFQISFRGTRCWLGGGSEMLMYSQVAQQWITHLQRPAEKAQGLSLNTPGTVNAA